MTRCSGESCRQGRQPCATPDACRQAENEDSQFGALEALANGFGYIAAAWAVIAVVAVVVWLVLV